PRLARRQARTGSPGQGREVHRREHRLVEDQPGHRQGPPRAHQDRTRTVMAWDGMSHASDWMLAMPRVLRAPSPQRGEGWVEGLSDYRSFRPPSPDLLTAFASRPLPAGERWSKWPGVRVTSASPELRSHGWATRLDVTRGLLIAVALMARAGVALLLAVVVWLSFTSGAPGDPALGYTLGNYVETFRDGFTYRVLWNTVQFLAVTLIVAFALALPMAWLMERTDFPGKPAVFTLMTVALLIP